MFRKLVIDNYRGVKHLELNEVARVNLLVGKNNTGKTSILEAISILAFNKVLLGESNRNTSENTRALLGWIYKLPFDRNYEDFNRRYNQGRDKFDLNREVISSLIYGMNTDLFSGFSLRGSVYNNLYPNILPESEQVMLKVVAHIDEVKEFYNNETKKSELMVVKNTYDSLEAINQLNINLESITHAFQYFRNSGQSGTGSTHPISYDFNQDMKIGERLSNTLNMQYIKTSTFNTFSNSLLYDKIIFDTKKMSSLITALRTIEPKVERFAYQANEFGERYAKVKLEDNDKAISVTTMGDGMNRILTIVLSLVNCQNGYIIIDEIENGLHYSVQKALWEIIFQLAKDLNIQVFATTHSNDAIVSFSEVLKSRAIDYADGKLFRLQRNYDEIIAVEYNSSEIYTSTKFDVEIR